MTVRSRYINGALAYYDGHRARLIDAIGKNVTKYFFEPSFAQADTADPLGFTSTVVEAGAGGTTEFSPSDAKGGAATITTDNAENDGGSYQLLSERFKLESGTAFYMHAKVEINDVDQTDLFIGLAITDTAILGGVTDRIGFQSVDEDAGLDFLVEKDSTETSEADVHTLVDATEVEIEFFRDENDNLYVFVDGVEQTAPALTNLPDDEELRLSIEFLTGEAAANTCKVSEWWAIQIGS